jgi:glycosyltransferase involved in cell wall biosynthesis
MVREGIADGKEMNVCFVSHSGERGGGEMMLLRMVDGLRLRGVECAVFLPWEGPLVKDLAVRQVPFSVEPYGWWARECRSFRGGLKDLLSLRVLGRMVSQLKRWKVDVVVTNTCVVPVGALAAFAIRRPHVWYIHEFGRADYGLSFYLGSAYSAKLMTRLSKLIIVNSEAVAEHYSQYIPRENLRLIYCGVDVVRNNETDAGRENSGRVPRLVLVGSYHPAKGQITAIKALKRLIDERVWAELVLVGAVVDRPYLEELRRTVSEYGLERFVSFQEYSDDPTAIMARGDIVLMCSRSEAFGLVTVEGMKAGKPVVGSRSGATPELIREGFNGLLYVPNDPADLAAKVRYLLDHPAVARRMGENGQEWADATFSVGKYIDAVLEVLNDALSGAHTSIAHMPGAGEGGASAKAT